MSGPNERGERLLPNSTRPRSYYGLDDFDECPCGELECMYFSLGYAYCHGCGDHHRVPVGAKGEPCPVDALDALYGWFAGRDAR